MTDPTSLNDYEYCPQCGDPIDVEVAEALIALRELLIGTDRGTPMFDATIRAISAFGIVRERAGREDLSTLGKRELCRLLREIAAPADSPS